MAQGKEGLGRALWRAPAPPCHLQSQRQFCLSLSPLTHIPRAGPGPTCPSVLSHRGLDQSVPPAAAQLHLPAAPGGNHLPPEQAGAPEGPGGCPGAGSEPPAPAGEGPGGCPGWGGQPHLSQSLQSSIHTSSSQLHIPVHGGSPARGGCTGDLVFAEHPEVGTELGGAGSSAGRVCARGGAISGALLGKGQG